MALTPSTMVALGTPLPDLTLPTPDGTRHRLVELLVGRRGVLVLFLSNHCPYVLHIQPLLGALARDLAQVGVATVGIHSNDAERYPADGPEAVAQVASAHGYDALQLIDADQRAARAFRAACTPDVFLYDAEGRLVYRGQLDGTRPGGPPATGADLRAAVSRLVEGRDPMPDQVPSSGCNIKWKPGHEPAASGYLPGLGR